MEPRFFYPRVSWKFLLVDISFFLKFQEGDNFFRTKLSYLVHECFAGVTNNLRLHKQPMFYWKMTFVFIICKACDIKLSPLWDLIWPTHILFLLFNIIHLDLFLFLFYLFDNKSDR